MIEFGNIADFQADEKAEMEGVDLSFGHGRYITIRRAGGNNAQYKNYFAQRYGELERDVNGTTSEDQAREALYEVYARTVVIGWGGWLDKEGKAIPYSVDNCVALFKSTDREALWDIVYNNANNFANFRLKAVADVGNE